MTMTRHATASTALLLLLALAGSSAADAKTTFNPSFNLGLGRTDNVAFTPEGDPAADNVATLQANLDLQRISERSTLRFRYRPTLVRYQEFEQLDYLDHRLDFDWNPKVSNVTDLNLAAGFIRTQQQGSPEVPDDPDLALSRRTDRDVSRVRFGLNRREGPRWSWGAAVEGAAYRYREIEDFPDLPPDQQLDRQVEDREVYGASLRFSRDVSANSSVGARYAYRYFDLETTADEYSHQLSMTLDHRAGTRTTIAATVGAFFNDQPDSSTEESRTGVLLGFRLRREYERMRLELDLRNEPTAGGALLATATNTRLALTLRSDGPIWQWRVTPRVARRESSVEGAETITSAGLRASVERRLGNRFGIQLGGDYRDQSNDTAVTRILLQLRWYPLRGTATGGR